MRYGIERITNNANAISELVKIAIEIWDREGVPGTKRIETTDGSVYYCFDSATLCVEMKLKAPDGTLGDCKAL